MTASLRGVLWLALGALGAYLLAVAITAPLDASPGLQFLRVLLGAGAIALAESIASR